MKRKLYTAISLLFLSQSVLSQTAVICPAGVCVESENEGGANYVGDVNNVNDTSFNDNTVGATATNDVTTIIQPDNSVNTDTRATGVNVNDQVSTATVGDVSGGAGGAGTATVGDISGGTGTGGSGTGTASVGNVSSTSMGTGRATIGNVSGGSASSRSGDSSSRSSVNRSGNSRSASSATAGSSTSSSGSSSASVKVSNPSNTNSTIKYKGGYTVRNTPSFQNYTPPATATCVVGLSASISLPGFGFGAGGYIEDERCAVQEIYRITAQTGDEELHQLSRIAMKAQVEHYNRKAIKNKYNNGYVPTYDQSTRLNRDTRVTSRIKSNGIYGNFSVD